MSVAKAFANNDVVLLVWNYPAAIKNCLGFCIERKDMGSGQTVPLESMVGFDQQSMATHKFQPTTVWPIQKFNWRDFTAESGATYQYTITPMAGAPDNLIPKKIEAVVTNQVTLSPGTGNIKAYFNRGILSTQYLARQVPKSPSGIPNYSILLERLKQPGDTLRDKLADELKGAVMSLLDLAIREGGECYCALYELNDPELIAKLLAAKGKAHIILSNTGADDGTNQTARASLHDAGIDITDRMLASQHIGHNKFVVYADRRKKATRVMTGSTNWTYTGLCAQSNNAVLIESEELAGRYLDYWKRLKDDDAQQGPPFRKDNDAEIKVKADGLDVSLWFSPNTKTKNKTAASPIPDDIKQVFELMNGAQKSILFLAFQPGTPSIIDEAAKIQIAKPALFIRGAATDLEAVEASSVTLFHRGITDPVIVGAQELKDDFAYWMAEFLKSSPGAHAVIHDKILVIDAFTDHCAVVTGSHNLGYRASYNNDENLLIFRGNKELATAYATHVMDIYDHYRWRYFESRNAGGHKFTHLDHTPSWQDPYFNDKRGESIDTRFWL